MPTAAVKVIKTEADYERARQELDRLMEGDPAPGTPAGDRLELLAMLIESYEKERFPDTFPDPVEAILFRMEQQGLAQRDLVPMIGSKSRVSEVLSRKRPLSLAMIRGLHGGLGIPAAILLREPGAALPDADGVDWGSFPLAKMTSWGWLPGKLGEVKDRAEEVLRDFLSPLGPDLAPLLKGGEGRACGLLRRGAAGRPADRYALVAWTAMVVRSARRMAVSTPYNAEAVSAATLREVGKLSAFASGPVLAREYLAKKGIPLVIAPHLPGTHLDGMALRLGGGPPIIGMTLRHDRLDNFWFVLLHELVHVWKHLDARYSFFYDDLDTADAKDNLEKEADNIATESLVPSRALAGSLAQRRKSRPAVEALAHELGINPAVVAGRIRRDTGNYAILGSMLGRGQVRKLFPDETQLRKAGGHTTPAG
jgi:HTH-type transcriptional regulator/antitoxin HigA